MTDAEKACAWCVARGLSAVVDDDTVLIENNVRLDGDMCNNLAQAYDAEQ